MRSPAAILVLTFGAVVLSSTLATTSRDAAAAPTGSCIRFWGEVRYGALAYNHIVHIANSCDAEAECVVSTDVNPEEQKVSVGGKSEVQVTTFLGSPARTFKPHVSCTMH
jgi:streptogramin lyase